VQLSFEGAVWYWRGPAPFHFVTVPDAEAAAIADVAAAVTYGWGMIPAAVRVGDTEFTTALWPKNGGYIVPLKDAVRRAEDIDVDDVVEVTLTIG
jgi:hypothetical protein